MIGLNVKHVKLMYQRMLEATGGMQGIRDAHITLTEIETHCIQYIDKSAQMHYFIH